MRTHAYIHIYVCTYVCNALQDKSAKVIDLFRCRMSQATHKYRTPARDENCRLQLQTYIHTYVYTI